MGAEVKFKAGDRVRFIQTIGLLCSVEDGAEYVVRECTEELVYVGDISGGFYPFRFELVEESIVDATAPSIVHRPSHYARFEIEPIEFIMRNKLEFWQGNVIKYVMRYDAKDGIQDLRKAARYIEMQIKKLEGNTEFAK